MAVDVTVRPVLEDDTVTGYEYRCSFCSRVGAGYLTEATAVTDAAKHRCQERAWNESHRPAPKES